MFIPATLVLWRRFFITFVYFSLFSWHPIRQPLSFSIFFSLFSFCLLTSQVFSLTKYTYPCPVERLLRRLQRTSYQKRRRKRCLFEIKLDIDYWKILKRKKNYVRYVLNYYQSPWKGTSRLRVRCVECRYFDWFLCDNRSTRRVSFMRAVERRLCVISVNTSSKNLPSNFLYF